MKHYWGFFQQITVKCNKTFNRQDPPTLYTTLTVRNQRSASVSGSTGTWRHNTINVTSVGNDFHNNSEETITSIAACSLQYCGVWRDCQIPSPTIGISMFLKASLSYLILSYHVKGISENVIKLIITTIFLSFSIPIKVTKNWLNEYDI